MSFKTTKVKFASIMALLLITILLVGFRDSVAAIGDNIVSVLGGDDITILCEGKRLRVVKVSSTEWKLKCKPDRYSPTSTPTPTPDHDHEPTPTPTPVPSITTTPTPTTPPVGGTSANMDFWHAPGAHDGLNGHEHGEEPPSWANEFSQANFGHAVMYGGDEATSNENVVKHQAYKGFLMDAYDASSVDVYVRYHAMSNPFGRTGPLHSYEIYAKDSSNNVSFWQGWSFYGYPELRSQRMTRRHEEEGLDGFPGRDQFIISSPDHIDWENYLRCEQWYGHAGLWSWDLSITICGASTFFSYDEHLGDFTNMDTWEPTGDLGNGRRLEITHYGPTNPYVKGEDLPFGQWFCAGIQPIQSRETGDTPIWNTTGAVSDPNNCPDGYLPQYVADTFPKKGVYFETGNTAEKDFPVDGVTLPN